MANRNRPARPRLDRRILLIALLLVLAVAAVYGQTAHHEFIAYDDDTYIFNNQPVKDGLTWKGLLWSAGYRGANWHPLTWLSHMLDCQIFGLWAGGHHLVSVGLHAGNAVLLFAVLKAMTGACWRSAAVAALFALHPLRVESVAWAAERKDVLSALFWLLTMGAYLRYARRPAARRYLAALGLFALGLAAKPMLVTLPCVLLLLDWWPLGRTLPSGTGVPTRATLAGSRTGRALLAEKVPFLALSLVSSLLTLRAQTLNVIPMVAPDVWTRLANAATSYLKYLGAFLWPDRLAFLYPYPREALGWGGGAAAVALALITVAALMAGRRRPYLPVGWLWYLGTLVPVIGLIQVGGQARSDRYTYLTLVGVAVALVWLAGDLWPRRSAARRGLTLACVIVIVGLGAAAFRYVRVWRDSIALFQYTVGVTRDNYIVLNNLGSMLMSAGRNEEASSILRETARIEPEHCNAHYNLGLTLNRLARHAEAMEALTRALDCYRREERRGVYIADTHFNIGAALSGLGRAAEAERQFRAALQIVPDYPGAHLALYEARARQGKR